jgi:undecaprenyl phosphate-alpha-L-ara4N flippase subunit ArnE
MSPLAKSMLLVLMASIIGSFGAVFLKKGSANVGGHSLLSFINFNLALGVGLYLASSVFYGFGIKGGQLSVLYPMISLGSIWTLIWSRIFFSERITREKLFGLGLILIGVTLVGIGS